MNRLKLTVLPTLRNDSAGDIPLMEKEGFVDEAVVLALLTGPVQARTLAGPDDLALPADDMDFAGWRLSNSFLPRSNRQPSPFTEVGEAFGYRAAPPTLEEPVWDEPGLGDPHRGTHRWWLAGLAGLLSTLLFSLLLLTLSNRSQLEIEGISIIRKPPMPKAEPALPKAPAEDAELTDFSAPK
jgi:hypothetical protein